MKYTITDEDLEKILEASRPVPMIMLQCGTPPSPQERANDAWKELGARMGFKWDTVRPIAGGNLKEFKADPLDPGES